MDIPQRDDIISFIKTYLIDIYKYHLSSDLKININDNVKDPFVSEFKPIELTIIMNEPKTKPTSAKVEDFLSAVEHPTRKEDGFVYPFSLKDSL